jgi:hypothetical protein
MGEDPKMRWVCFKRVTLNLAKVTDDAVEEMLSR